MYVIIHHGSLEKMPATINPSHTVQYIGHDKIKKLHMLQKRPKPAKPVNWTNPKQKGYCFIKRILTVIEGMRRVFS